MSRVDDRKDERDEGGNPSHNSTHGLNQSVVDALENLDGEHEVYKDEKFKKLTSLCIDYLQEKREVPKRDMKVSIYLKFLDDPSENTIRDMLKEYEDLTEKDIWEISRSALDHLDEKTDYIEKMKDGNDHKYIWKD